MISEANVTGMTGVSRENPAPTPQRRPLWKRALRIGVVTLATVIVGGGALHMPFARGLLMRIGGCPMAAEVSPQALDHAHQGALAQDRGSELAPARPALGFALGSTTRDEVLAWARNAGVACEKDRGNELRCERVRATAVGGTPAEGMLATLSFGFNAAGRVVDIASMRAHQAPEGAYAALVDITGNLAKDLGAPHRQIGAFDIAHLSQKSVSGLASASYHYRDYLAEVTSMAFDSDGLVIREHYAVIVDGS